MAEHQPRRKHAHRDSSVCKTSHIAAGIAGIVILCGGYYFGDKVQLKKSEPVAADAHFREEVMRKEVGDCNLAIARLLDKNIHLKAGLEDLQNEVDHLQSKSGVLFNRHEAFEKEAVECSHKAEAERKQFDETTVRLAAQINKQRGKVDSLKQTLDAITDGRGNRISIDLHALRSMRKLNSALLQSIHLGEDRAVADEDTLATIEAELLTKWGNDLDNEALFNSYGRRYEMMTYVKNWMKFEYDPSTHTQIVPVTRGLDDSIERVKWNGESMKQTRGIEDNTETSDMPANTLASAVVELYDTALCSYKRNSTPILYPSVFDWVPALQHAQLSSVVDSPLVTFCYNCADPRNSSQYHLACGYDTATRRQYGSYQFWSMRSLLRFSQAVYDEADRFMAHHGLEEGEFTAVVNHVSTDAKMKCSNHERINYGPHRLWIEHNYGKEAAKHVSDDRDEQCAPSESDVKRALQPEARGALIERTKIYLSAPDLDADEIKIDTVKFISYEVRSAIDEAVDLVVASRARRLIVSPFFQHSQIVTELFLLRNGFDPQGVTFF